MCFYALQTKSLQEIRRQVDNIAREDLHWTYSVRMSLVFISSKAIPSSSLGMNETMVVFSKFIKFVLVIAFFFLRLSVPLSTAPGVGEIGCAASTFCRQFIHRNNEQVRTLCNSSMLNKVHEFMSNSRKSTEGKWNERV